MKIKTLVAMLFLSAGATTVVAQDATNCNSNSSISHEAVRAGNFKERILLGKLCWIIARHCVSTLLLTDIKSLKG